MYSVLIAFRSFHGISLPAQMRCGFPIFRSAFSVHTVLSIDIGYIRYLSMRGYNWIIENNHRTTYISRNAMVILNLRFGHPPIGSRW